jgi:hypothetical protein
MGSHIDTESGEPDGIADGQTSNATQQSKHFQRASATVLCGTVNSKACTLLWKPTRISLNAPRQDFELWPIDMGRRG